MHLPLAEHILQAIETHLFPLKSPQFKEEVALPIHPLLVYYYVYNEGMERLNFALTHHILQHDEAGQLLAIALQSSRWDIVQRLLEVGITIDQPDKPLDPAIFLEAPLPVPTLKILLEKGFFEEAHIIREAIYRKSLEELKTVVKEFGLKDPEGEALELALSNFRFDKDSVFKEIGLYLIENNISQDPHNRVLEIAKEYKYKEIVRYLSNRKRL